MAEINIAGIMRAGAYSPNHIGNDTAIFNAVAEQLRKRGCIVNPYSEEQFNSSDLKEDIIVNMCREHSSIMKLQQLENAGRLVINSGFGIENCTRERMTRILLGNGIPYPDSLIVNTNEVVKDRLEKEDVSYVRHSEEAQEVLQEYFLRGIKRAVINVHLVGDLIKFYGVRGTNYFFWFYPFDEGHSKYGHEAINGKSQGLKFDVKHLKTICNRAADELNVEIYGGDCIVGKDGDIKIIDFNDWPSFAPCRYDAAPHIAKRIISIIKNR